MCKQTISSILCVAGLALLLFCFIPTWLVCVLGIAMIIVGILLLIFSNRRC